MAIPPSPALVPVLHPHPMRSASRELFLLWQRAEAFRFELELESQLQLQGLALLPPEWTTYLEHQRQMILDTIQRIESREDFTSGENVHSSVLPENEGKPSFALIWHHSEQIITGYVRSPSHASPTTFSEDGPPSQETHTIPVFISSTIHGHTDGHIRQYQAGTAPDAPSVNQENTQRDTSLRTARTHRDAIPRGVERAHYQPGAGFFNSAQSITISGGVFNFIQGNVSSNADEILAPE
jgi:hypothetical protein